MNYAPEGKPSPVCGPGDFPFAAAHLDHGHIYGQCNGLIEAGGTLRWVYDPEPSRVKEFCQRYPQAKPAADLRSNSRGSPRSSSSRPRRCQANEVRLGCRIMAAGKDYFTDKTPFTTLDQLEEARQVVARTRQKYMVYYSERLHVECAVFAGQLIEQGAIGRVFQTIGFGPHRLNAASRPAWFFRKSKLRRDPVRHRQPPIRAVPVLHRGSRRRGEFQRRRQFQQSAISRIRGLRRGLAHSGQRRFRLLSRRLVNSRMDSGAGEMVARSYSVQREPSSSANTSRSPPKILRAINSTWSMKPESITSHAPERSAIHFSVNSSSIVSIEPKPQ